MPGTATWDVGTITVPASTGTQAVTGLRGQPLAVFFYGTNWLTEDAAVTTTGVGMFRGMACPQWDSPSTIIQNAAFVIPPGDAYTALPKAITALDTSGGLTDLYTAELLSFDSNGFTLDWGPVASGGYKVVYVALMDTANVGAYEGLSTTLSLGWKAGASMLHGTWNGPVNFSAIQTQQFYGSAAYPGTGAGSSWFSAGLTNYVFPTSTSAQNLLTLSNDAPSTSIANDGNFTGPFLAPQNVLAYPSGGSFTDFVLNTNLGDTPATVVIWDDEDNKTGRVATPAASQGGTVTVSGLPFSPGLVIGYCISDEPPGLHNTGNDALSPRGAIGFSVATPDFQWSALVDGVSSRGAFQSFQRGFTDHVSGTSVHAGTVELTPDGFVLTTEEDDVTAQNWLWHAFGHPFVNRWIPQIFRSQITGARGRNATNFVLLEDGGRIVLEDGSGFLLL